MVHHAAGNAALLLSRQPRTQTTAQFPHSVLQSRELIEPAQLPEKDDCQLARRTNSIISFLILIGDVLPRHLLVLYFCSRSSFCF